MASTLVTRQRGVGAFAALGQTGEKGRRQKRHVARYHQYLFRWRFDERRIQTAERPSPCHAIRHHCRIRGPGLRRLARDDQDVRGQFAKQRQLPVEDRIRSHDERALVDSAEPARLPARENRSSPHTSTRYQKSYA